MSDLLNSASLVLIPSGYKEDIVYSAVPTDGSGDLSFTRASNGTRINSAGLVEVCPWNLLEQSNAFSTSPWAMNVTSGQAGKDGQNNAWLLTKATATSSDYYLNNVYNGNQTFTIYVKKESGKGFKLYPIGTTTTNTEINLQTGVVLNQGAGITSTTVEAYSSTWWKISVALNMINSNYYIYVTDGAGTQIASSITIQDAQVNIGLTAKPYFPTTDRLNVARLTYQNGGGGCPSLLLEKQSTNLALYSEQFDDAAWSKGSCTITANNTTSPDGTQNADLLIANNGVNSCDLRTASAFSITNGASYTWSLYVKSAGYRYFQMTAWTADDPLTIYDLTNISVISESGPSHTSTITDVGNGWRRITITRTTTSTIGWLRCSPLANSTGSAAQNGTDGAYIWGAQVEASSYFTSYIPTTSASATRVADACFKTGISSLIGQTSGTLFVDVTEEAKNDGRYIFVSDGSATNRVVIYQAGGVINVYCSAGATFNLTYSPPAGRLKIAFIYKSGDYALWVNGVQRATSTESAVPTGLSATGIGSNENSIGTPEPIDAGVNQAILFPTRLTNAELASLTTL